MKRNEPCKSKHPQTGARCWLKKNQHGNGPVAFHWAILPATNNGKVERLHWTTPNVVPVAAK